MRRARFTGTLNPWNGTTLSNPYSHFYIIIIVICNYNNYDVFCVYILFSVLLLYALSYVFRKNIIYDVLIFI